MKIIPALDIMDGKCVRLTQGNFNKKKIYNESPLKVAKEFEKLGIRNLHLVDLDGAKAGRVTNWNVVKEITSQTHLAVDFGGGIKTKREIERLFKIGVRQVNLGSIAIDKPERVVEWIELFGVDRIILSADVRDGNIAIDGWEKTTAYPVTDLLSAYRKFHIELVTCTDISRDGTLKGPNLSLYEKLKLQFPEIKFTASGGVSSIDDVMSLRKLGLHGVIIGKAIYEGRIDLNQLATIMDDK